MISTEIADIFRSNSLKNGFLPLVIDKETHSWLMTNPAVQLEIDLETNSILFPNGKTVSFNIEGFARYCLLNGVDELGYIIKQLETIKQFEQGHS